MRESKQQLLPSAFKRLAYSNLAAQFSEQIALATAPLVAAIMLKSNAAETSYLQAAQTLPFLLLSLLAGVLVDRFSRARLMAYAEALRAVTLSIILLLIFADRITFSSLAALGFIGATGTVMYSVAAPAIVPTIVGRVQLALANRWLELARSIAFAAGPAVGGALVGWMGAAYAYLLAIALSVLAVWMRAALPSATVIQQARRNVCRELSEGAKFVVFHHLLRPVLATAVFFNFGWSILQSVYAVYALSHLHFTASEVGFTLGTYGIGMLVGALLAPSMTDRFSFGSVIVLGPLCGCLAAITIAITLWIPSFFLVLISFFFFGVGPILWTISTTTLRQAVSPDNFLGRISAVILTATFGARPIGAAVSGIIAAEFGAQACILAAATAFLIQFAMILMSPIPRLRQLPEALA